MLKVSTRGLLMLLIVACGLAVNSASATTGGSVLDLLKSSTRDASLKPGVAYQGSLFAPHVRIIPPESGWRGHQWIDHGYNWFNISRQNGGIAVVSAPASKQSAATTLHLLETERADSAAVGISIQPQVGVTIGGFRGWQFDGTATGQYGHTFVPFSGHARTARESAGDKRHYDHGKAFRIIVLDVRGKPLVFLIDSDAPKIDLNFSDAAEKLIKLLRFPKQ
jgi:hypothetical protein